MKVTALALAAFVAAALFVASSGLPAFGDPGSAPSTHVSPRYIERGAEETGAINLVTGILADYRGYDTLGETAVIFTAGLACLLIVGGGAAWRGEDDEA
jgi:multicomponent Na+:H+ antiporter subunit B